MKKIISLLLSLTLLFVFPISCYAEEETSGSAEIDDKAKSSILLCADTGEVIYEKNAYEHLSPASVTKVMSMLLVLEAIESGKISPDDEVSTSENAVAMGGSQIWLEQGETMTVDELFKAVVIASANDACTALAEYIAGSTASFVTMMNERAKELGLENTNFENCTGLDDTATNHYSCAYDIAVMAREVIRHDLVRNYTTVWLDYLRDGETELNNTNKLVNSYNGITGLKTGTTSKAGFCVCATAERDGMSLIAVVLGAQTSDERFESAANLLDYGFANYEVIAPQIDESMITQVRVKNGKEKSILPIYNETDKILVKKGSEEITYSYNIEKSVAAPVAEKAVLGEITIKSGNNIIKKIELYAGKPIEKINFSFVFKEMLKNI
ncbi:MAG TPA: D-alanyl-D-alanine carboxypeptidase [Candidatus Eubacterium faecavium]|nr:D-alanyl-D-alanine carboxypeptidase [Candidatus Eubacterium faecavium]